MDQWGLLNSTTIARNGSISQAGAIPSLSRLSFTGATLASVDFPPMDGSSRESGALRDMLRIAKSTEMSGSDPAPSSPSMQWGPGNFKLTIPGVTTTSVRRIESFSVAHVSNVDLATGQASGKRAAGPAAKLLVTISESTSADWVGWLNASASRLTEKTLSLDLQSTTNAHLATMDGTGVGIVALRSKTSADGTRQLQAELYVRDMQIRP